MTILINTLLSFICIYRTMLIKNELIHRYQRIPVYRIVKQRTFCILLTVVELCSLTMKILIIKLKNY